MNKVEEPGEVAEGEGNQVKVSPKPKEDSIAKRGLPAVTNAAEGLRKVSMDQGFGNVEAGGALTKVLWGSRVLET